MEFELRWGGETENFKEPWGIATSSDKVFVADSFNYRIKVFTKRGAFLYQWSTVGNPYGIAVDETAGEVYVTTNASTNYARVNVYNLAGALQRSWGSWGSSNGQFKDPRGIAFDGNGFVYVADKTNDRIQKFQAMNGAFVQAWGTSGTGLGQLDGPEGLAVDGPGNILYVSETGNDRIHRFTLDGTDLGTWGSFGTAPGSFRDPTGLALDSLSRVWVAEETNARFQLFDNTGTHLGTYGGPGSAPGLFGNAVGIAVGGSGEVYVMDNAHLLVNRFVPCGTVATPTLTPSPVLTPCVAFFTEFGPPQIIFPGVVGVDLDAAGNIYVSDGLSSGKIRVYNPAGVLLRQINSAGGAFQLVINRNAGLIYAVEPNAGSGRVGVYNLMGTPVPPRIGPSGSGFGQILGPTGIGLDADGNIFVADAATNDRINKYSPAGLPLLSFGGSGSFDGQLKDPLGVGVDGNGNVHVADSGNGRIQIFDGTDGSFLRAWGKFGALPGQFSSPQVLRVDSLGRLWMADTGNDRVQVFDLDGNLVGGFGVSGTGPGRFNSPQGLGISPGGLVYVGDAINKTIQVYRPCSLGYTPTPTASPTAGPFVLRLDVGSVPTYTDQAGNLWLADQAYAPGGFGYTFGGSQVGPAPQNVANTFDDLLYQTYREGTVLAFKADLPAAGTYIVTLKLAAFSSGGPGQNVFDVFAQGLLMISDVDIANSVGLHQAMDRTFPIDVDMGVGNPQTLSIEFVPSNGLAFVSGIEIQGTVPHPNPLVIYLDEPAGRVLVP